MVIWKEKELSSCEPKRIYILTPKQQKYSSCHLCSKSNSFGHHWQTADACKPIVKEKLLINCSEKKNARAVHFCI